MLTVIAVIILIVVCIYVCIIVDKSKKQCHKQGCKHCGRCHRMREDAEK